MVIPAPETVAVEARSNRVPGGSRETVALGAARASTRPRRDAERLRLAFVVQRYGDDVNGGAEYHCRLIAEHLARQHQVEVLTTCAKDYITWRNEHRAGLQVVNGVRVRRFKVKKRRDPDRFGRLSQKVFLGRHDEQDELAWLDEQGPLSPKLLAFLKRRYDEYDYFVFFSYRYYHSFYGVQAVAPKAVLVPTAERDEVIDLAIFKTLFRLPRAIVYNSVEERAMIWQKSGNRSVRGEVVGVGSDVPASIDRELFRTRQSGQNKLDRYIIYIGRIDQNKGCRTLFNYYRRYREETRSPLELVLVGGKMMDIPDDPGIRYVGFFVRGGKVECAHRRRASRHALGAREPFHGDQRSLVNRKAGSREWQVRRAEGPVPSLERRSLLRRLLRVPGRAVAARGRQSASRRPRPKR